MKMFNRKSLAFTLAEVLIVVGIIGIIAEITIPTLVSNIQDQKTIGMLKKEFSVFSQAYSMAVQDNGTPDNWNLVAAGSSTGAENMLKVLAPYFKVTKFCGTTTQGCFPYVWYKTINAQPQERYGDVGSAWAGAQLVDGTDIHVLIRSVNCTYTAGSSQASSNVCADIGVDINGDNSPNAFGQDYFRFSLTKYGLVPQGGPDAYSWSACLSGNGSTCTAWLLYNNNTDYLRCPGSLSWSGPTKCP